MKPIIWLVSTAILIGASASPSPGAASAEPRLLMIAAPAPDHAAYREQAAILLPAWRDLLERDFVIETRFGTKDFFVTLIGKDGGEKLRRTTPLTPTELFAIVDAVPMRRAEMQTRAPARK